MNQEVNMQFVRAIVESSSLENVVEIPREFKNRKVEILILPLQEKKKKKEFNPEDFEGVLDLTPGEIESELREMRDEWDRI
jgi:hypothetical protein